MKLEEFNEYFEPVEKIGTPMQKNATVKKDISLSRPDTYSKIEDIESNLYANYNIRTSFIEGDHHSKIMFFYGKCGVGENIALASYIPRGYESYYDNEKFLNEIQLFNYRIIELINPRYLIIMSNYCIKMLLATDLSSMSLRGKWFDFNTPNDTNPKKTRVLYEPTLLMNNPDLKKDAWEDLKEIKSKLGG